MNDERRGFGFGFGSGDLAFLRGWLVCLLGWLLGVESGSKVGSFCWIAFAFAFAFGLCLALLLVLLGESFGSRGKKGESASSEIVLAPLECLTIYTLHPAGER